MHSAQLAAQLYTVRDSIRTPAEIANSLKKMRAIGYTAVQVSGMGPVAEDELARMLVGEGLTCCSTHEPVDQLLSEPQRIIERLGKLGCRMTACPHPGGVDLFDTAQITQFAQALDASGARFAAAGMRLCYHNHHLEFVRTGAGVVLDQIYNLTSPRHLFGELDTYWVQFGGQDAAAWCRKLKDRLPCIHMKDYCVARHAESGELRPTFAAIGQGNLDWPAIVTAAESSGCEWFIVEQDTCPGDPFDALKQSYDWITEHLCTH